MNSKYINKIDFKEIKGFRIGNAQDYKAMTGVTTIIFENENQTVLDYFIEKTLKGRKL